MLVRFPLKSVHLASVCAGIIAATLAFDSMWLIPGWTDWLFERYASPALAEQAPDLHRQVVISWWLGWEEAVAWSPSSSAAMVARGSFPFERRRSADVARARCELVGPYGVDVVDYSTTQSTCWYRPVISTGVTLTATVVTALSYHISLQVLGVCGVVCICR